MHARTHLLHCHTQTVSTSLASLAFESNPVVYISGAIGAVVSPMAAIQQNKLTQVVALKETNARMRDEVDQLKAENVDLSTTVSSLESSVSHLQELSHTLDIVRAMEGQSLDELEKQVAESEQILDKMQDNLRGTIVQTLISMVLAIDHDGDMCLSDAEIDSLIHKMEELSTDHFDFKDQVLRQKLIENGRSLNAVMDIIKNLMDDDAKPEDSIFAFINNPPVDPTSSAQVEPLLPVDDSIVAEQAKPPAEIPSTADVLAPENTVPVPEPSAAPTPSETESSQEVEIATEEAATEVIPPENVPSVEVALTTGGPSAAGVVPTENDPAEVNPSKIDPTEVEHSAD